MKKTILTIAILVMSIATFSQEFDGVRISGDLPTAIQKYKDKGYKLVETVDNVSTLEGRILNMKIELMLFVTPKTKKLFKAVVFLPKEEDWSNIKSQYEDYLATFRMKYGPETQKYEYFKKPYYEGDGYEMTAVGSENCVYVAYWLDEKSTTNTNLALEISKYKQLKITYENKMNMNDAKAEMSSIKNKSF